MKGYSDVLVGLQYGDEGKGRVIDNIASQYDVIVRFNGGPNAGHTLDNIVLHQIPSGIKHPNIILYIGSGCVLNLEKLAKEIEDVKKLGIILEGRLYISEQATVIQPHHILLDKAIGKEIGTTVNGIGPAYADRALRSAGKVLKNLRLGDLLDDVPKARRTIVENYLEVFRTHIKEQEMDIDSKKTILAGEKIKKYVCKNPLFLTELVENGKKVLFEGAQATMLDVTKGTVPYVTSSHTIAGNAYVGGDLSPKYHRKTIGVAKAIMSRVGNGPFVSEFGGEKSEKYCAEGEGKKYNEETEKQMYKIEELLQKDDLFEIGIALRMLGGEYGATTKRPRRIGMLDLVLLRHGCLINGVDEIYLNKIDCLGDFAKTKLEGIPLVTEYELNGTKINYVPGSTKANKEAKPVISYYPIIKEDLSGKTFEQIPHQVKNLVHLIETYVGCEIKGIGVGRKREEFILM